MHHPRSLGRLILLSLGSLALVLTTSPAHSQTPDPIQASTQAQGGYPVASFLGLTTFPELALAPGAKRLAFVTAVDNFAEDRTEQILWRMELAGGDGPAGTGEAERWTWTPGRYSSLQWAPNGRRLAFLAAKAPTWIPQLFVLEMRGGNPQAMSLHPRGVTAFAWGPDSATLYFSCPEARAKEKKDDSKVIRFPGPPEAYSIFRRKVNSGARSTKLAVVPHTVADLAVAPDGKHLAYLDVSAHEPMVFVNGLEDHEIYLLSTEAENALPRRLTDNRLLEIDLAWTADGKALFGLATGDPNSAEGRFTQQRVIRIDVATGQIRVLAPVPRNGSEDGIQDGFQGAFKEVTALPAGGKNMLLATANLSTHTNIYSLSATPLRSASTSQPKPRQRSFLRGTITQLTTSPESRKVAFVLSSDKAFPEIYLADSPSTLDRATAVTHYNRKLARRRAPKLETVRWTSERDTEVEGVVYWPPGQRGTTPLPLIVDVHGGPWGARNEELAFNTNSNFAYFPALLASRGFLVLAPNYRGGTGRGDDYFAAVNGFSCSRPAADVLAGVNFLVQSGWADPERLGIIGYSYGGLVTNCLLGRTDRFQAAVSGAGIWNDVSYFGTADNFMQTDIRYGGAAPWEDFEAYWRESAMSGAGNITTPTLITHGGSDRRVPSAQGFELYRALRRRGIRAELMIFPDEGHMFRKPSHKLEKVQAEIAWLEEHLANPTGEPPGAAKGTVAGATPDP